MRGLHLLKIMADKGRRQALIIWSIDLHGRGKHCPSTPGTAAWPAVGVTKQAVNQHIVEARWGQRAVLEPLVFCPSRPGPKAAAAAF